MAGKRYAAESEIFNKKYNVNFSISDHYDFNKKMNAIDDFVFDANSKNAALNIYVDTLASALSDHLENISNIKEGRLYTSSDISIGDFIEDFDRLMQAKFADEAVETKTLNTHKPLEGSTYSAIANAVWNRVKHFDKPTPDVWADNIVNGNLTLEDIKKVVDPAGERLSGEYNASWDSSMKSDYLNVLMAKQALDKVIAGRSFWWKVWPGNWGQWYRETQYSKQLENDLVKYNLLDNAPDEADTKEVTEKSMISGAKNKLNEFLKEKAAANKTAPDAIKEEPTYEKSSDEAEMMLDEKSPEEVEEYLDQKAKNEDKMIDEIIKREEQAKLNEQMKEAARKEAIKNIKKPTNIAEMRKLFADKKLAKNIKDQFVELMAKATNSAAGKEARANTTFSSLGMMITETWTAQNTMHAQAIKFFKVAYNSIKNDTPDMSVGEKLVAAQKMTDIMLGTYSPSASDPKLAQYGDNYGVQKLDNNDIKELTGYEGDVNELMTNVKVELGLAKSKVQFADGEFTDGTVTKTEKVEEKKQDVPTLEAK